jgi:hypothetical protein
MVGGELDQLRFTILVLLEEILSQATDNPHVIGETAELTGQPLVATGGSFNYRVNLILFFLGVVSEEVSDPFETGPALVGAELARPDAGQRLLEFDVFGREPSE